jgi:branched-chain amino acid transport system ATP-binding protein
LTKNFDGLQAVGDLSFRVGPGEVVGLIGPNGAGKTTAFNLLSGFLKPSQGQVSFLDQDITGLKPNRIAAKGLIRTFQLVNLVGSRTVLENILVAYHLKRRHLTLASVLGLPGYLKKEAKIKKAALAHLGRFGLLEAKDEPALNLPHGGQKALGICLALAADPKLLLLDEPTAGMSRAETDRVMDIVAETRNKGVSVMLVEHDLKVVMGACDRIIVLNFGHKIAEGTPEEVAANEEVITAYLGFEKAGRHG